MVRVKELSKKVSCRALAAGAKAPSYVAVAGAHRVAYEPMGNPGVHLARVNAISAEGALTLHRDVNESPGPGAVFISIREYFGL